MSTPAVLFSGNDRNQARFYPDAMSEARPDWYLKDWLKVRNRSQQWLADQLGAQKSLVSRKATGFTPYDRDDVNAIARLLEIEPHELLMRPETAMAQRKLHDYVMHIAAENRQTFTPAPTESEDGRLAPPPRKARKPRKPTPPPEQA